SRQCFFRDEHNVFPTPLLSQEGRARSAGVVPRRERERLRLAALGFPPNLGGKFQYQHLFIRCSFSSGTERSSQPRAPNLKTCICPARPIGRFAGLLEHHNIASSVQSHTSTVSP